MNNTELTLKGITERLVRLEGPKYKKMEGSSYDGVIYEIYDELCDRKLTVDIRLVGKHNALIFEMYPGINVVSKDYIPGMAMYCQEIKTTLGSVNVERIHRNVKFHAETCYEDNPVTEITIEAMEKAGIEVFRKHFENLNKLATGRTLDIEKIEAEEQLNEESPDYELDANVRNVRDYLMNRSHHNAICESLSENGEAKFHCHILTETDSFKLDIIFKQNGFMTFKGSYGENAILISKPYRYGVADYLNEQNTKHMYSTLNVGDDSQGVYGEISTSLMDGVIGDETIEFLEMVLLKSLRDSAYAVQMLSVGIMPREEEEKDMLGELEAMGEMLKSSLADRLGSSNGIGRMPGLPIPSDTSFPRPFNIPAFLRNKTGEAPLLGNTDIPFDDIDLLSDDENFEGEEEEISMDDYLKGLGEDDANEGEEE